MANNVCNKIWREASIGHYGGLYVEIPKEHFITFKKMFPKQQFPRRTRLKNVAKTMTVETEARFHKKFPKSHGQYYDIHFADGTKGVKTLEKLIDRCPRKEKARVLGWNK